MGRISSPIWPKQPGAFFIAQMENQQKKRPINPTNDKKPPHERNQHQWSHLEKVA